MIHFYLIRKLVSHITILNAFLSRVELRQWRNGELNTFRVMEEFNP